MIPPEDQLTLDALLSDPLTRLVMRSDNQTPEDMAQAFHKARAGLAHNRSARYSAAPIQQAAGQSTWWSGY